MVSAIWHGVYTGYYACIGTVPFVLAVEDIWIKLLLKNESRKYSETVRIQKSQWVHREYEKQYRIQFNR